MDGISVRNKEEEEEDDERYTMLTYQLPASKKWVKAGSGSHKLNRLWLAILKCKKNPKNKDSVNAIVQKMKRESRIGRTYNTAELMGGTVPMNLLWERSLTVFNTRIVWYDDVNVCFCFGKKWNTIATNELIRTRSQYFQSKKVCYLKIDCCSSTYAWVTAERRLSISESIWRGLWVD